MGTLQLLEHMRRCLVEVEASLQMKDEERNRHFGTKGVTLLMHGLRMDLNQLVEDQQGKDSQ